MIPSTTDNALISHATLTQKLDSLTYGPHSLIIMLMSSARMLMSLLVPYVNDYIWATLINKYVNECGPYVNESTGTLC